MSMVRFDLPTPEGDTVAFWEAAKEERLLIKHCLDCDAYSYYPRPFCPTCWSEQVEWYQASGAGMRVDPARLSASESSRSGLRPGLIRRNSLRMAASPKKHVRSGLRRRSLRALRSTRRDETSSGRDKPDRFA